MREMDAMPTDAVVDKVVLALIADIRKGDRQGAQSEYERAQADVMLYSSRAREASDRRHGDSISTPTQARRCG